MPDGVESFGEIQGKDADITAVGKKVSNVVENRDQGSLGRACWSKSELIAIEGYEGGVLEDGVEEGSDNEFVKES